MSGRRREKGSSTALAALVEAAVPLHAVNVAVIEAGQRQLYNAEDVLELRLAPPGSVAERVFPLVRRWIEIALQLRAFHETRLCVGDHDRPAQVVLEWKLPTRGARESVAAGAFAEASPAQLGADAPGYPLDLARSLQEATQTLLQELGREPTPVRVDVRTELLNPEDR